MGELLSLLLKEHPPRVREEHLAPQDAYQVHPDPKSGGQDPARKVVQQFRGRGEAKAHRRGSRPRHGPRRQAHKLRGVSQLQDHLPPLRGPLLLHMCRRRDNNLFYLEAIHNFVEVLNEYFHNVCELDLVFNFYKVYTVVDEMFLAGEMRETSQTKVLKQLLMLNSLE